MPMVEWNFRGSVSVKSPLLFFMINPSLGSSDHRLISVSLPIVLVLPPKPTEREVVLVLHLCVGGPKEVILF